MASNTQTVIVESEHEYLNPVPEKPVQVQTTVKSPVSTTRTAVPTSITIAGTLLFIFSSVISVIQLVVGHSYANDCRVEPRIPRYLYIAGIVGLTLAVFGILQNIFSRAVERKALTPKQTAILGIPLACAVFIALILLVFLFIWFIFGCIWVFRVWNYVQYIDPDRGTFCHPFLYRFAFALLLASLIYKLLACVYSSYKASLEVKELNAKRTKAVSTEP